MKHSLNISYSGNGQLLLSNVFNYAHQTAAIGNIFFIIFMYIIYIYIYYMLAEKYKKKY